MVAPIFKNKIALGIFALLLVGGGIGGGIGIANQIANENGVFVSYINHASIMIEYKETLIYIDPYDYTSLDRSFEPADYIFITHNHGDHYDPASIALINDPDTQMIAPNSCTDISAAYDVFGVIPEQTYTLDNITIETIVMDTLNEGHTREMAYCGYLITINDVSIYHSGDTRWIEELSDLSGRVDVACIPIGGQCSSMGEYEGAYAVQQILPKYVIPIHYGDYTDTALFERLVNDNTETKVVWEGPQRV